MLMYLSMNVIVPLILRNEVGNNPSAQGIVNNILLPAPTKLQNDKKNQNYSKMLLLKFC